MIGIPAVAVLKKKNNSNRNDYTNKPTTASIFSALLSNSSSCLKVCPARLNSHEFFLGKIFFFLCSEQVSIWFTSESWTKLFRSWIFKGNVLRVLSLFFPTLLHQYKGYTAYALYMISIRWYYTLSLPCKRYWR